MITFEIGRPESSEYAPGFAGYVARVPEDNILESLDTQVRDLRAVLSGIPAEKEQYRYAEGKWSIREVLGHIIDTERIFGYRALCVARGETVSLPGFDENAYAENMTVHDISLAELLLEFESIRRSHVLFFSHLSQDAWRRVGTANKAPLSTRAMAYAMVGHVRHHLAVLNERYLAPRQ